MNRNVIKVYKNSYSELIKVVDFLIISTVYFSLMSLSGNEVTVLDVAIGALVPVTFFVISLCTGFYHLEFNSAISKIIRKVTVNILILILVMFMLRSLVEGLEGTDDIVSNANVIHGTYAISYLFIFAFRFLLSKVKIKNPRIAILGLTPVGISVESGLIKKYGRNIIPDISFYDDRREGRFGYLVQGECKGNVADLLKLAQNNEVDEIYITMPMIARERIKEFLHILSDSTVDIIIVPDLYTYNLSTTQLVNVGGIPAFSIFSSPFEGLGGAIKRAIDLGVGSIITICILPVMLAVAVGVKLSSPGPILFKQDRYGLGGKKIKVWKFRSMKVMENSEVVTQATKGDPRVTKFGSFIRRTSLDELPQFFNVLQGTMSIVGPRPHAVSHNEQYRKIVHNYMIRHKVKPGITGLAQIKGYRGETDTIDKMEKRVEYDIRYMQNWTPLYDFKIIFLTIFKGFVSETAY